MAVLKDLIVHGNSRFINTAQFDRLEANTGKFHYIEAASGSIDELTSKHIITQVLDVEKELHTKEWTNANIANIGGTFYIAPTVITKNTSPKIAFSGNASSGYTVAVNGTFATNFIKPGKNTSATNWTSGSEILLTGTVSNGTVDFPMGTLMGTLSGTHTVSASGTSKTITIVNVTDSKGNKDILQEIINIFGTSQVNWLDGQLSLKTLGTAPIGILLTSMGTDNKTYMDIYGGQNANGKPNVRIGDLNGISATINGKTRTLEGWGIFTDNGYFEGEVTATVGYIGGFTIGATNLYNSKTSLTGSTAGIFISTTGIAGGAGNSWWIKSDGTFQFGGTSGVRYDGSTLTVPAANVSGALTAATISADKLTAGTINSSILTANNIVTDTITMGTAGSNSYIYVSKNNKSTAINGETKNWRIILGNVFGVSEAGYLTATSGTIGGYSLTANYLQATDGTTGMSVADNSTTASWAFWAGGNNTNTAKFRVTHEGILYATGAIISGALSTGTKTSSTSGTGTYIDSSGNIYSGSGSTNNFQVTSTGILTATEAILKSVSLRDSNNKTRAAIDTNGLHVYDSNGNVKADFGTNIVLYGGSTTTSGNLLIQNNQIVLRDNTRELFTVKTNEEIISVNYSIEQVALLTGEIYCEFQAGRTISTVKSVTFAYTVNGTQRLQTYNSEATAPSGTSATYFNSLSIKASSDKTKIICSFAPKSNSTIVNYVTVTFTTADVTSYILAGSYPNLSHSHILKLGNGTSTSSTANALAVGWDGTGHFSGDVIAYCMSDSKGGISLGEYKPAGYYSWGDGSQSAGTERYIEVEAYRCGRMVQLTAVLQPWDINVGSGSNICNLNINGSGIPKPPDNVSGVAYYGARPIIGTLWNDGSTLRLTIRNLGTTAFSVTDSALRLSIVYMTEY